MNTEHDNLCRLCGEVLTAKFPRVADAQTGETFSIAGCPKCELGHTQPVPIDLGPYYGTAYYGSRHGVTANYCDRRRVRFVSQATKQPGRLLDVGCGEGTFLLAARQAGWAVTGNEMNPEPARRNGLDVSTTLEGGPYDCITLWHSLEHMPDPVGTITKLSGMLSPGGVLIAAVPDAGGLQARVFGARWLHLDVPRHLFHFGSRSLRLLFEKAGLRVERQWHQEFEYDLFGWAQSALNCAFSPPNVFFHYLTGRPTGVGAIRIGVNCALGGVLLAGTLPLAWGGTLVMAGRRDPTTT
jgi:SAM-dependent methyltransferase